MCGAVLAILGMHSSAVKVSNKFCVLVIFLLLWEGSTTQQLVQELIGAYGAKWIRVHHHHGREARPRTAGSR